MQTEKLPHYFLKDTFQYCSLIGSDFVIFLIMPCKHNADDITDGQWHLVD